MQLKSWKKKLQLRQLLSTENCKRYDHKRIIKLQTK